MIARSAPEDAPIVRYFGRYPGKVVSDQDPNKAGYLQVRVDEIYGAPDQGEKEVILDDDLPWAKPTFAPYTFAVPAVGSYVWVEFWGGMAHEPVWTAQWDRPQDVPDEAQSSYSPGPKTFVMKLPTGHTLEFRWKKDEEQVHLDTGGGSSLKMFDASKLGGPKIVLSTPGGFSAALDEKNKNVTISLPSGRQVVLDDQNQKILVQTTKHSLTLDDAGGKVQLDAQGEMDISATGKLSVVADALLELAGASVTVGSQSGSFQKLMDVRLIALINVMVATFNAHIHPLLLGVTAPPISPQIPLVEGQANTEITTAD